MPAKFASVIDAVTSKKGATLLAPAILLFGATLAAGQNSGNPQAAKSDVIIAQASTPTTAGATAGAKSSAFTAAQRKELETFIKEYLLNNPEILMEAQNVLEAKMDKIQAERTAVAIKENSAEIFRPIASPVVGNSKGDVTVIEFFDYNCGYCKKAISDVARLIDKDPKVKLILKEFPILAKGSEEASRVALAAKMQGKYWEFHRAMLENQGQANEAAALRIAEKVGLDVSRLKKDMASAEVKNEIDETRRLAAKLGIQGTPHFLIGERVIPGAPENLSELLNQQVQEVRREGCKVC
jgi:protein-disulfide isomerase